MYACAIVHDNLMEIATRHSLKRKPTREALQINGKKNKLIDWNEAKKDVSQTIRISSDAHDNFITWPGC